MWVRKVVTQNMTANLKCWNLKNPIKLLSVFWWWNVQVVGTQKHDYKEIPNEDNRLFVYLLTNKLHNGFSQRLKGCVFAPAPRNSLSPYRLKFFHMQHHVTPLWYVNQEGFPLQPLRLFFILLLLEPPELWLDGDSCLFCFRGIHVDVKILWNILLGCIWRWRRYIFWLFFFYLFVSKRYIVKIWSYRWTM